MKQLCKGYQVLRSRCRKLHFPSIDTGTRNAQLTSKASLGKPGILPKTLDVV